MKKPLTAIIITSPDPNDRLSEFDKYYGAKLDLHLKKYSGEELGSLMLFLQFIFEKFRKPAKKDLKTYIITCAFCNIALMLADGQVDAIYYPSVPSHENGINLCINRPYIKSGNIELKSVLRNEFEIIENEEGKHFFKEVGRIEAKSINLEENKIIWSD